MKLVKAILILLAVLAVVFGLFWQFWLKDQVALAKVATAYGAKQVCSCLFVAGREMESCRTDFTQDISAISFEVKQSYTTTEDHATITQETVRASALAGLISDTAQFEPGLGCTLVKP